MAGPPKHREPLSLGSVLGKSARLVPKHGSVPWLTWRDVVGNDVARRSSPRSAQGSTLFVTVSSSAWAQELSLLSDTILARLRKLGFRLTSLRFNVGVVELPKQAQPSARVERRSLPPELEHRLEAIEDPKLRALIEEAASYRR